MAGSRTLIASISGAVRIAGSSLYALQPLAFYGCARRI
jgi:hypothetical protein